MLKTKTQEVVDGQAHEAAVDLRMVQVSAVAVGREVLRLLDGVDAGEHDASRIHAILVGCFNIPDTLADTLTKGAKATRDAIGQTRRRLLAKLVAQFRMVQTAEMGKGKNCEVALSVGDAGSQVVMANLDEGMVGLVSKGMQLGVEAARRVLERMLEDLPTEEPPARAPLTLPDGSMNWVGAYAVNIMGMTLGELALADQMALVACVTEHMKKLGEEVSGGPVIIARQVDRMTMQRLEEVAQHLRHAPPAPVERAEPITTQAMHLSEVALRHFFQTASGSEIEELVDAGLRHRDGMRPMDFIRHWCAVARCFGYATRDDSPGELEKTFAIMVKRLVLAERRSPPQT